MTLWSLGLALIMLVIGLIVGAAIGIPAGSPAVILRGSVVFAANGLSGNRGGVPVCAFCQHRAAGLSPADRTGNPGPHARPISLP